MTTLGAAKAAKVRRLVDEGRVVFPGGPVTGESPAVKAVVRSTTGRVYEVWFDDEGHLCSCAARGLCSHAMAAMVAWLESREGRGSDE